jgi:hypothetical protein
MSPRAALASRTRADRCGLVFALVLLIRTPRIVTTLVFSAGIHALGLFCGLGASACTQSTETSQETPQETNANEDTGATCDGPTATSSQAVEEKCLQACMAAYDRMLIYCQGLPTLKARRLCRDAATAALAVCIARCPD